MAAMINEQLAFAFGILGNIISVLVFLSPGPTFYRIFKKKSTESFHSLPYQVALFSCMLWLYYALLNGMSSALLLITINSFGCVVETIYLTMFFSYASRQSKISSMRLFAFMNVGLFSLVLIVTQLAIRSAPARISVLGWICVAISVSVFAAPLSVMVRVIKTKSVEFMPFNLSFFLTLSAIFWFGYGMFKKDFCVALPNVGGFILGMLQMILYAVYRHKKVADAEKKLPENTKNVAMISKIVPSETSMVDIEGFVNGGDAKEEDAEEREKTETDKKEERIDASGNQKECPV
ncbi:hypothetical protein SLEP1_g6509 [Rubroshorea leprosula]|uniref:Bidirectional sugar transporter SWEET n=1 Tax=Rubroshorea leprosula TaxID=152421 RepID=A0AAV5I3N4_9ROSI|nr:hypothetical protein SLEP1_g6509 [Rubroshorea leprosula]